MRGNQLRPGAGYQQEQNRGRELVFHRKLLKVLTFFLQKKWERIALSPTVIANQSTN
jgi:hypothetical protein